MEKKYKAFFVNEEWHTLVKRMAAENKVSVISLVQTLLDLGKKEYEKAPK